MARNFVKASSHYIDLGSGGGWDLSGKTAFTIACWARATSAPSSASNDFNILSKWGGSAGAYNQYQLFLEYTASNTWRVRAAIYGGSTLATAGSGATHDTNWHHVAVSYDGTNLRVYKDATNTASASGARTLQTVSASAYVGAQWDAAGTGREQFFDGDIAEAAVWPDVALDATEIAALAKGFSPLLVRPGSLAGYLPLMGNASPEPDIVGGTTGTVSSAAKADHPRVYMPIGLHVGKHISAADPNFIARVMHHLRQQRMA